MSILPSVLSQQQPEIDNCQKHMAALTESE